MKNYENFRVFLRWKGFFSLLIYELRSAIHKIGVPTIAVCVAYKPQAACTALGYVVVEWAGRLLPASVMKAPSSSHLAHNPLPRQVRHAL